MLAVSNPITLWDMYQFYAHVLIRLFDELRDLEMALSEPQLFPVDPQRGAEISKRFLDYFKAIYSTCDVLQLSSSRKQLNHIGITIVDKVTPGDKVAPMLAELRRRIREDLEDHVYLCIPEDAANRFYNRNKNGCYQAKVANELMDPAIVKRFPSTADDIEAAYRCYALDCFAASMFHLMRVVEGAVLELARIIKDNDSSPSWGSILHRIEKIVLRTKYEDVDSDIQPHRPMLENLLPQMQAVQRAWRNKFTHTGGKIIPTDSTITESMAFEILIAVEAFMRQLALDLPARDTIKQ